ncbi:hypothetical protein Psal071_03509 (plasmid) [Piscirickettsia salmonis]|uniref:Uncharacterized protein n=1 Tax=Piscirickettsia salmonis TaxID=1238 RepID=A0A9Q6LIL2_PISSA|nr:hypothetical protein [Piscirickettsia salmonis]QGN96885.1 hypothetical protein Psal006a_03540 [Piscirickettsia salmonis]QGO04574.1 hypothetical protein Psal009_00443 [Piscirickettsia salmonis]QGO35964.1 hypothetical protein Psal028_03347 [Piscirickettsia salmonis]QGO39589.1 hypothetical protein Psal040_03362 [Piscirickettsia salmonis]QGO46928.1 hypothetical protein Psal051_03517 [Piscirickettsia salmonis]
MFKNKEKLSIAINQSIDWLKDNKPKNWYSISHRSHDFKSELSALIALKGKVEDSTYTIEDVKDCIRATGKHKHSFISFLHDSGFKGLNHNLERDSGYIDMKSLFFENFKQEDRQSIYNTALSLD